MRLTPATLMATKKAFAQKAFITGIVCVILLGLGWLADPLTAAGQTSTLSKLLAWPPPRSLSSWRSILLSERLLCANLKKTLI
jgi:hypothetical protein